MRFAWCASIVIASLIPHLEDRTETNWTEPNRLTKAGDAKNEEAALASAEKKRFDGFCVQLNNN